MRRELTLKEGQKYLDHNDIGTLLDDVFVVPEGSINSKYACFTMPCNTGPCNRSPIKYKPNLRIKQQE